MCKRKHSPLLRYKFAVIVLLMSALMRFLNDTVKLGSDSVLFK